MSFSLKQNQKESVEEQKQEDIERGYDENIRIPSKDMPMLRSLGISIADPPTIRQSDCLIFSNNAVRTFSGDLGAVCNLSFGFTGVVYYKNFLDVYKRFKDRQVLFYKDGTSLVMQSDKTEIRIPLEESASCDFSGLTRPDDEKWITLSPEYKKALTSCASVVRNNNADNVVSSIAVERDKIYGSSTMEIMCKFINSPFDKRFLIRAKPLLKVLKKPVSQVQLVDKWLYFLDDETHICYFVPIYDDEYIDVDEYLQPVSNVIVFPRGEMLDVLDTCMGVVKSGEKINVELDSVRKTCVIKGRSASDNDNSGYSYFKGEVSMETPLTLKFSIEPTVLRNVVSKYPECTICMGNGIHVNTPEVSYAASIE